MHYFVTIKGVTGKIKIGILAKRKLIFCRAYAFQNVSFLFDISEKIFVLWENRKEKEWHRNVRDLFIFLICGIIIYYLCEKYNDST